MEEKEKKIQEKKEASPKARKPRKKVSKTWKAAMKLKGSLIVNDPKFLL